MKRTIIVIRTIGEPSQKEPLQIRAVKSGPHHASHQQ